MHNVELIKQVQVVSSQFMYEQIDDNGLNGTFIDDPVTLMVDIEAVNQISITLASLACDMEGELTISVNGNLSDTVILRILGKSL